MSSEQSPSGQSSFEEITEGQFDNLPDNGWSGFNNDYIYLDRKSEICGLAMMLQDIHDYALRGLIGPVKSPFQIDELKASLDFAENHNLVFDTIYFGIQHGFSDSDTDSIYTERVAAGMDAALDTVKDLYMADIIDESSQIKLVNFAGILADLYIHEEGHHFAGMF